MRSKKVSLCVLTTKPVTVRTFLLDQLCFLSRHGFNVTVITDGDADFKTECPPSIEYVPVKMTRSLDWFSTLRALLRVFSLFRHNQYDIIQYSTPKASLIASVAGWAAGVPVRLYCQWGIRYTGFHGWRRWFIKQLEKLTCALSTHISPDSISNQGFAIKEGLYSASKTSVVMNGSANGVDLARFDINKKEQDRRAVREQFGIGEAGFLYGFVGRIHRDKGVNEMITAFTTLAASNEQMHLMIVGSWEEHHQISSNNMDIMNTHPRIHMAGFQGEVQRFIAAFDVMVFPSYREGFGLVAIEAGALGVPVVAFDIPGPRDAIIQGKTGFLVTLKDTAALEQAMAQLYNDRDLLASMARQAVAWVSQNYEQQKFWQAVLEHRRALLHAAGIY